MERHKTVEWEEKKPFNVEFTSMKLYKGEVVRATGYETDTNMVLTFDHKGNAYCVISPDKNVALRVDEDGDCENMTLDELSMLLPVPQPEYNIRW